MTKAQLTRIRRKHERAVALLREAHELGRGERSIRAITGAAVDAGEGILRDWAILDDRERNNRAAMERHQRDVAQFGRCTKCGTGAAAEHKHCSACGWPIYRFGAGADQCHNERCELYELEQEGEVQ